MGSKIEGLIEKKKKEKKYNNKNNNKSRVLCRKVKREGRKKSWKIEGWVKKQKILVIENGKKRPKKTDSSLKL